MNDPWDEQKTLKYRDHDLVLDDIREVDFLIIKSQASKAYVETNESNQSKLIISAFMGFLTSKGYRISKKDTK